MATLQRTAPRLISVKTAIKEVLIHGLRDIFTDAYEGDRQFRNLHIENEFPIDRLSYPAIIIKFEGRRYTAAGVGHYEIFPDPTGAYRKWDHRRFEGTIEFTVAATSTQDRDILSDALFEALAFGRLVTALNGLLVRAYGAVGDPYNPMGLLFQISLNTDELEEGGDGASLAPWGAEDSLVYTSTYSMEVTGGFYNAVVDESLLYIEAADVQAYLFGSDVIPFSTEGDPALWSYTYSYLDGTDVIGAAVISAIES